MDRQIKKRKWGLKRISGLAAIALIAFIVAYYFLYQDTSSKLNVRAEKIIISAVSEESFQEFIPVLGMVLPVTTAYLDAIEGGRVEKKYIEAGAWVKKGDKILLLSNTNLVINVMQREAEYFNQVDNLQKARLSMEQYKLNYATLEADLDYQFKKEQREYEKNKSLFAKKTISRKEYESCKDKYDYLAQKRILAEKNFKQENHFRKVQIEQLEASLKRIDSNLDIIKEKLDALTIKAPISGQLASLNAEIGQSKLLGQRLGQINVMTELKVLAGIDEHYIARVKEGKAGTFDFDGETSEVGVSKIFPDVREGQFRVEMKFSKKPPKDIRIGQTLHIKLALGDLSKAIIIPRGGFYQSTAGQWVYVLDESGEFAIKRDIKLGRKNAEAFEILAGLKTGEKVITSNYDNFEGMDKLILK